MRKVSQTAAQIVDLAENFVAVCTTFDSADSSYNDFDTKVSEWFLLSSDNAEVTVTIVEDDEHSDYDYVSLSVTVKRV
jgi:hypothetical protein